MSLKQLKFDPVFQLLTGRFEEVKIGSNVKQVFVPSKRNPNPTILELLRKEKDMSKESILIREGLIKGKFFLNTDVFVKTETERDILKSRKAQWKALQKLN